MSLAPFLESDLLPLSALQHLIFCERQCALIHIEQVWAENVLTVQGRQMHDKVHEEKSVGRCGVRIEYGMPLRSLRLGLAGKADVVEFHREKAAAGEVWRPFPVEYKRGKPKADDCDKVQLCAQALCMEEMLGVEVKAGALFYGKTRRREDVAFDQMLRAKTSQTASRLHKLIAAGVTPKAIYERKCDSCSLLEICLPKISSKNPSRYLAGILKEAS